MIVLHNILKLICPTQVSPLSTGLAYLLGGVGNTAQEEIYM